MKSDITGDSNRKRLLESRKLKREDVFQVMRFVAIEAARIAIEMVRCFLVKIIFFPRL